MGKATDKLNALRRQRDTMQSNFDKTQRMYGNLKDSAYAALYETENKILLSALDREIRTTEAESLQEKAMELSASMLGNMTKQATRAGKELADAFQKGFNSR